MIQIGKLIKEGGALGKCMRGLSKSTDHSDGEFCPFCGTVKWEFINPNDGRLKLLDCDCEKYFKMINAILHNNGIWLKDKSRLKSHEMDEYYFMSKLKFVYDRMDAQREKLAKIREAKQVGGDHDPVRASLESVENRRRDGNDPGRNEPLPQPVGDQPHSPHQRAPEAKPQHFGKTAPE